MSYMLGIDVGNSGAKAVLVAPDGQVAATATEEYRLSNPRPLWSEQDPADWWRGSLFAIRRVIAAAGIPANAVAGIGLTG